METELTRFHSHFITYAGGRLHVMEIGATEPKEAALPPLLFVHGSLENGRIFYSKNGKGLAPWLANKGFSCYVLDLAGKGQSEPLIATGKKITQFEALTRDLPMFFDWVAARYPGKRVAWISHSWGGSLLNAAMIRSERVRAGSFAAVHVGVKRTIRVKNLEKWFKINFIWFFAAPLLARFFGYLPAKRFGIGADDESRSFLADTRKWIEQDVWIDPEDRFSYNEHVRTVKLPSMLYITGEKDRALAHPEDVRRFIEELHQPDAEYQQISEKNGLGFDAGHIDILTHPKAATELFPYIFAWLDEKHKRSA